MRRELAETNGFAVVVARILFYLGFVWWVVALVVFLAAAEYDVAQLIWKIFFGFGAVSIALGALVALYSDFTYPDAG